MVAGEVVWVGAVDLAKVALVEQFEDNRLVECSHVLSRQNFPYPDSSYRSNVEEAMEVPSLR